MKKLALALFTITLVSCEFFNKTDSPIVDSVIVKVDSAKAIIDTVSLKADTIKKTLNVEKIDSLVKK